MANPLITNFDRSKTFVWNARTETGNYTNSTYDDVTLLEGTLMGRISASGLLVPLTSGASDGSQFPVGIVLADTTIEAGDTAVITIVVAGDVVSSKVIFQGSDTLNTVVSGRRLVDRIGADTVGIKLVGDNQLTGQDNQ
jgi:hypothetical protein